MDKLSHNKSLLSNTLDIKCRPYQLGDDADIVDLLVRVFPDWWGKITDPLKYWRWKYLESPLNREINVAVDSSRIVGCEHSIVFNAKLGSEVSMLTWGDDLAVDPNYRGMKISMKMLDFRRANRKFVTKYYYETTINPYVKGFWKKIYLFPFVVNRLAKIEDLGLHLKMRPVKNDLIVRAGYTVLNNSNTVKKMLSSSLKLGDDFSVIEVDAFDEGIDAFWGKVKDDYNFILERRREFLNWRFRGVGRGSFKIFHAVGDSGVLGYLVVKISTRDGYSEGQIEDLLTVKGRLDVADALLGSSLAYLKENGVNAVFYQVCSGHPYESLASRRGFLVSPSKPDIMLGYSEDYTNGKDVEIEWLRDTQPSQVSFNYAETI